MKNILIEMAKQELNDNKIDAWTFINVTRHLDSLTEEEIRDVAEDIINEKEDNN